MSKFLTALIIVAATFSVGLAQNPSQDPNNPPNMGIAPKEANGIGRLDLRVVDESGNPIRNAHGKLESTRTDGYYCESWNDTDERGVAVLPPIHMGSLKLIVKAKGFKTVGTECSGEFAESTRARDAGPKVIVTSGFRLDVGTELLRRSEMSRSAGVFAVYDLVDVADSPDNARVSLGVSALRLFRAREAGEDPD